ncbi:MAG: hypothetical protein WCF85_09495 [Rhodospirillaceae bacterium]
MPPSPRRTAIAVSVASSAAPTPSVRRSRSGKRTPTVLQLAWLRRGLSQPGGKLPLFDDAGQRINSSVVRSCREAGWVEPWFYNPLKPAWEVCRLTDTGRSLLAGFIENTESCRYQPAGGLAPGGLAPS